MSTTIMDQLLSVQKPKAGIIKAGTGYAAIDRLELKALEVVR